MLILLRIFGRKQHYKTAIIKQPHHVMVLRLLSFKVCAVLTLIRENMPIIRVQICHCLNECSICRTGQTLTLAISRCSLQSWQIFRISLMFHLSPSTYKISSPWTFFFLWRQRKTFMIANVRVSHGTWIGLDRLGCLPGRQYAPVPTETLHGIPWS